MSVVTDPTVPDRNLALELVRVTESRRHGCAPNDRRVQDCGRPEQQIDLMRRMINAVAIQGIVVIGEGEKDEAPMLFNRGARRGGLGALRSSVRSIHSRGPG